jgi:hypothetical protein
MIANLLAALQAGLLFRHDCRLTCGIIADLLAALQADLLLRHDCRLTCSIIADLYYSGILATPTLLWDHAAWKAV